MVPLGVDTGAAMRSGTAPPGLRVRPGIGAMTLGGRSSVCAEILPELSQDR